MTTLRNSMVHLGAASTIIASLALTACNEETTSTTGGDTSALQARLATAEEERKSLKAELEELKAKEKAAKKEAEAAAKMQESDLVNLKKQLREAKREQAELEEAYDSYREEYKVSIRQKAKGRELGNLTLSSGASYTGVVVSKWTPAALRVTHAGGNATLPFEDLPEPIQSVFLYDKDETAELLAKSDEAVTTGKREPRKPRVASTEKWPTKDPNGNTRTLVTEPEHTGIINTPAAMTQLDKSIAKFDVIISKGEAQVNELDKKISEAVARGSESAQGSLEKKTERIVAQLQTLGAQRGELLTKRQKAEMRMKKRS